MDHKWIKFVAAGWCITKWSRLNQIIRNLTFGDLLILFMVIPLGVTGLRKSRVVYLLDLFERRGRVI